jgi:menaquinone-specific isochorismate synthase
MTPIESSAEVLTLSDAAVSLAQKLKSLSSSDLARPMRIEIEIEPIDPLAWLASQKAEIKSYWQSREGTMEIAGIDAADTISDDVAVDYDLVVRRVHQTISDHSRFFRYLGGIRFATVGESSDENWKAFGAYRFVLPRFEIVRLGSEHTILVCNLLPEPESSQIDACIKRLEQLSCDISRAELPGSIVSRTDSLDKRSWNAAVTEALEQIRLGQLNKVVLARKVALTLSETASPWALLAFMMQSDPNACHFAIQPTEGFAFIGSTPELLYRREYRHIETEAVAGTRPRGETTLQDDRLGRELQDSEKDRYEQRIVTDFLSEAMDQLCSSHNGHDKVSLLKTARVQHLVTRLRGTLRLETTDADILKAIHPTPAVAGVPRDAALAAIAKLEPFDRGWYAGAVGWLGGNNGQFDVGIRSALVHGKGIDLYSGAGIVDGSTPEDEWNEIEQKISGFLGILEG